MRLEGVPAHIHEKGSIVYVKIFSYESCWKKHWGECHDEHFKLDTPDGKKEYGCIPSCPGSFERAALLTHQWEEHPEEPDAGARFETTNSHQISSTRNTFPGASYQPPSSFQQIYSNQPQLGPQYVKYDTPDDGLNVKCGSYPDILTETFPDNSTSHGNLHDTSLVQARALPEASNDTTQVWSGATSAPPTFNANYGLGIDLSQESYMGHQIFPEFGQDGDTSDAVQKYTEWSIGPNP